MVGNYIDFGIIHELDEVRLQQMLDTPDEKALGTPELARLRAEVHAAKRLAYVCDNCGEVVLDMLLMGQMQKENPSLEITALVRGEDVLNDVTVEDAHRVGLDSIVRVVAMARTLAARSWPISAQKRGKRCSMRMWLSPRGRGTLKR